MQQLDCMISIIRPVLACQRAYAPSIPMQNCLFTSVSQLCYTSELMIGTRLDTNDEHTLVTRIANL